MISTIISLITGKLLPYILGGLGLLVTFLGYGAKKKHDGKKQAQAEAKEADYENAKDIRNRVDNADQRLRDYDDAGFRD